MDLLLPGSFYVHLPVFQLKPEPVFRLKILPSLSRVTIAGLIIPTRPTSRQQSLSNQ